MQLVRSSERRKSPRQNMRTSSRRKSKPLLPSRRRSVLTFWCTVNPSEMTWSNTLVNSSPALSSLRTLGFRVTDLGKRSRGFISVFSDAPCSYVRPPIIVSDVSRPHPMTVKWSSYAQSVSKKPMKGMLTGPVTILNWSFPRADVSRELQSKQLALALRDEVVDLEKAGIQAIQVDEPAIREGVSCKLIH